MKKIDEDLKAEDSKIGKRSTSMNNSIKTVVHFNVQITQKPMYSLSLQSLTQQIKSWKARVINNLTIDLPLYGYQAQ